MTLTLERTFLDLDFVGRRAAVIDHVLAHPESHDQGVWITQTPACGTTACLAGWTCRLAGDMLHVLPPEQAESDEFDYVLVDGVVRTIPERAAELLGLEYHIAVPIFMSATEDEAVAALRAA